MDMDDDASTAGQLSMVASISFRPEQMSLIEAVERQVAESSGIVMIDSGAALSVVAEKVCEVHGLQMSKVEDYYTTADGSKAKLLGVTSVSLQFNDYFQIDL